MPNVCGCVPHIHNHKKSKGGEAMGFDWEGILGEDGYAYVCNHGLDCYGYSRRSEGYSSSYDDDDYDDYDYDDYYKENRI